MGGNRTYFFYSDEGLVAEFDAAGAEIRSYGYEPDSQWTTNPIYQREGGTYYWYRNDHQGTPQKIVDTTGRVVWAAFHDSFGNAQITTEDITNNLRFAGQYYDGETGLYYNLNRYYDSTTGRYLRTDPFGDGLNLYAYVYNNPGNLIDPLGYCAVNAVGRALGTGYGEESAQWYADKYNETGNPIYFAGGIFASLWTPDTWLATAGTLATAGVVGAKIKGAQTTYEAAKIVAREVTEIGVEEAIGIPVPIRPKFHSRSGGQIFEGSTWDRIALSPKRISTPHGPVIQSTAAEARAALSQVRRGVPVYRKGKLGYQRTSDAQHWSLQHPATTKNYENKMGMPSAGSGEPWIMKGTVKLSSQVITRRAPSVGKNIGGDLEAVTPSGGVAIEWFHMP